MAKIHFFLAVLIFGFLMGPQVMQALQKNTTEDVPASSSVKGNSITLKPSVAQKKVYEGIQLQSKSAYVWDIKDHRKLFGFNDKEKHPLASVTKMMTAVVAVETMPLDTTIEIQPEDLIPEGDSGFYVGEKLKFSDLLDFTLVSSSNDGASAIANTAGSFLLSENDRVNGNLDTRKKKFVSKMNAKADAIGLQHTTFFNESGLDVDEKTSGAYGSARDMAMLFDYIFLKHPAIFTSTSKGNISIISGNNIPHRAVNTNPDVDRINGILGSKTGYTDLAGGNLVVVVDVGNDHPVVISVLGSTREGRFADVETLIFATQEMITGTSTIK